MSNPIARSIATTATSAACAIIGWTEPAASVMALVGVILSAYYIWQGA
jgi:hypothetical protein